MLFFFVCVFRAVLDAYQRSKVWLECFLSRLFSYLFLMYFADCVVFAVLIYIYLDVLYLAMVGFEPTYIYD